MAKRKTLGQEIIEGLTELRDVIRSGEPLSEHFTVRTWRKADLPGAAEAEAVRLKGA